MLHQTHLSPLIRKKNYAVTSDIISICSHSTQNHFELKINDSLLVFFDCVLSALSSENSGLPGEQEEAQKTWVNNCFPTYSNSKQSRPFVEQQSLDVSLFSFNGNGERKITGFFMRSCSDTECDVKISVTFCLKNPSHHFYLFIYFILLSLFLKKNNCCTFITQFNESYKQ